MAWTSGYANPLPGSDKSENLYTKNGVVHDLRDVQDYPQGMAVEAEALGDANSTASNNLYYGGSAGAANADMQDQRTKGVTAFNRAAPTIDQSQSGMSRGLAMGAAGRFDLAAGGDPNSLAQQQMNRGYMDANARILAGANSARGGHLAQAVARRTAQNMVAGNTLNQNIQSRDLMGTERMNAYGQLSGLGAAMRGVDQDAAFKAADMQMRNRGLNDAEMARREALRQQVGVLGLQGQQARQDNRTNIVAGIYGQGTLADAANQRNQERTENAVMGGAQAAFSAGSKLVDRPGGETTPVKPKDEFAW